MGNLEDRDITEKIIGCAFTVHRNLGAGFLEKVYENTMLIELRKLGIEAKQQVPIIVFYEGQRIGEYFADLLIEEKIISATAPCVALPPASMQSCELKAGLALKTEHEVQLVNYLTATGFNTGLLLNFWKRVEVKRKFREHSKP